MNSRRWIAMLACSVLALAWPMPSSAAPDDPTSPNSTPSPHMIRKADLTPLLSKPQPGHRALDVLDAADESLAAARNHVKVDDLRTLLKQDKTAWLSRSGRLFFVDHAAASDQASALDQPVSAQDTAAWASHPLSDTFKLHSKLGSKHTVFLDFDGYAVGSDDYWATDGGINAGSYGGFNLEGSSATFTDNELAYIQEVWRIVSEKYAPFDIDVTTQEPADPIEALNRLSPGDDTYGTRAVITNDMNARGTACTASSTGGCIGIAWVDVFNTVVDNADQLQPAWIYTKFKDNTPVFSAGTVANAAAHEIGHTLSLWHDSTPADGFDNYYEGHDDWFPIMGYGTRAVGHFTNGMSYPDELTGQVDPTSDPPTHDADDFDVITKTGAPLRSDDVTTTLALGSGASYSRDGIIERPSDTDTYSISRSCTGDLTASATGIGLGQALDLKVTIKNPSGTPYFTADPATSGDDSTQPNTPIDMDASATAVNAGSGTWTIEVTGTGLPGSTGYLDYGSVGQYHLEVASGCTTTDAGAFISVPPYRLLDTRNGTGAPSGKIPSNGSVSFQVSGQGGVPPSGAGSVVLNVTVTNPTVAGFVTAYPTGATKPNASSLNFNAGQTIPNHVTVKLGTGGKVTLFNGSGGSAHLIADVAGWYVAGTGTQNGTFNALASPWRLLDTRNGTGAPMAKVAGGATLPFLVAGATGSGIPATNVGAGVLNLTVTNTAGSGFLTGYPNGATPPTASNLNLTPGTTIANAATIKLGSDGKVALFNGTNGLLDAVADVAGWFTDGVATVPRSYTPLEPTRLLDTRNGTGTPLAKVPSGGKITLTVANHGGVPSSGAAAAVLNVTATNTAGSGFVTAYPAGTTKPNASNLNVSAGQTIANLVTVKLGSGGSAGKVTFYNGTGGTLDLVADVAGYYLN